MKVCPVYLNILYYTTVLYAVLVPGVLTNQTVVAGQAIHLTCRVDTHTMHPLHWLKEVDTKEINKNESQLNYLQIGDQKYKVSEIHKRYFSSVERSSILKRFNLL